MIRRLRSRRQLIGLIAIAIMLLGALAPALTRTLAPDALAGTSLLCTSRGLEAVSNPLEAPLLPAPADQRHGDDHCPLCRTPGDELALPQACTGILATPRLATPVLASRTAPVSTRRVHALPPSRAPPRSLLRYA